MISKIELGPIWPIGASTIAIGPAGVFVPNGGNSNGEYYGLGIIIMILAQWNISDPDMKRIRYFFPSTQYDSVYYDNHFDNNPYVIIGNSIVTNDNDWPSGVLDPISGEMKFIIPTPGTKNM